MENYTLYNNPLVTRYATEEMSAIFSEQNRITYFRKLWLALAQGEKEQGLDITEEQINELQAHLDTIDFETAKAREKVVRHDVMAHIYAYGLQCPKAAPIIHLGATSCYVTDNADVIIYREALQLVIKKLVAVIDKLSAFALKYKNLPTLGFTHYQPAQLVTVGKRATLWIQDFLLDYQNILFATNNLMMRGVKGTTGTQASFLSLFEGDIAKIKALDKFITNRFGFKKSIPVSGQTYTRKIDYNIVSVLSMLAQSAYKLSIDVRLLQNMKELEEPFEKTQIGSSAMAYKRNPMRSERISSLARYLMSLPINCAMTAATQGFERTLDDSANRRIVMGQAFLTADALLELLLNVTDGFVVYEKVIRKHVMQELPFMATETILMECVKAGGDRQELHERIRVHSMEATKKVRLEGKPNDLIKRIQQDPAFTAAGDLKKLLDPRKFIGCAPRQVSEFIQKEVRPIIKKFSAEISNITGKIEI
ncbi:MAG: adenylosuccinate lyase [Clostridia bacterium]|nr:adenylosuccinate lyase [Clostridia bacterium]